MKKTIKLFVIIIIAINLMACSSSITTEQDEVIAITETSDTSETNASSIELETNDSIITVYPGEIVLDSESVMITEAGTYYISGTLDNGQIIVDAEDSDEVELVLSYVSINSNYSAAIYVKNASNIIITTNDNSELTINADISSNVNSVDGVIYSKSDLTFNGNSTLTISSDYTHGIVGKDDVEFISGSYNIEVVKDGVQVNDSVSIVDSTMVIIANNDGIQVENDENTDKGYVYLENSNLTLITGEDAINASNYVEIISGDYNIDSALDGIQAENYINIIDGNFNIKTGGGYQGVLNEITVGEGSGGAVSETDKLTDSMKAIKANDITVTDGDFVISCYEDGFNANNDIIINGGNILINAGDEAITAQNELIINDGIISIENGYEGLEAVYITINGGDITINVYDDGINGGESYSVVTIAGGNLKVTCQGDGLDSNGDMVISGGYIILDVTAIYSGGDGNVDVTGTLTYTGGTIVDASGNTIDPTQSTTVVGERKH
jgi:hypothetical protein